MPAKFVDLDGVVVHCLHTGPSTLPDVPPALDRGALAVLVHGAGRNAGDWRAQLAGLAAAHSAVAVDLPGHGRSPQLEGLAAVEAYAAALERFLDRLVRRPAVLVGWSMGAAVALCVAARSPARVRALALLAEIAVVTRRHAGLDPDAKYREPITVEDVLASRVISSPLHLLDCCIISDGGGALVLTSAERARDCRRRPVAILGAAEAARHQGIGRHDLLDVAARQSGPRALARAGVVHGDVDVCLVYDSYTITVLVTLEALGFCRPGEGGAFVSDGRIGLGGALPVNTDGGGLSSDHPGMRGIFLVGERPVVGTATVALA